MALNVTGTVADASSDDAILSFTVQEAAAFAWLAVIDTVAGVVAAVEVTEIKFSQVESATATVTGDAPAVLTTQIV